MLLDIVTCSLVIGTFGILLVLGVLFCYKILRSAENFEAKNFLRKFPSRILLFSAEYHFLTFDFSNLIPYIYEQSTMPIMSSAALPARRESIRLLLSL